MDNSFTQLVQDGTIKSGDKDGNKYTRYTDGSTETYTIINEGYDRTFKDKDGNVLYTEIREGHITTFTDGVSGHVVETTISQDGTYIVTETNTNESTQTTKSYDKDGNLVGVTDTSSSIGGSSGGLDGQVDPIVLSPDQFRSGDCTNCGKIGQKSCSTDCSALRCKDGLIEDFYNICRLDCKEVMNQCMNTCSVSGIDKYNCDETILQTQCECKKSQTQNQDNDGCPEGTISVLSTCQPIKDVIDQGNDVVNDCFTTYQLDNNLCYQKYQCKDAQGNLATTSRVIVNTSICSSTTITEFDPEEGIPVLGVTKEVRPNGGSNGNSLSDDMRALGLAVTDNTDTSKDLISSLVDNKDAINSNTDALGTNTDALGELTESLGGISDYEDSDGYLQSLKDSISDSEAVIENVSGLVDNMKEGYNTVISQTTSLKDTIQGKHQSTEINIYTGEATSQTRNFFGRDITTQCNGVTTGREFIPYRSFVSLIITGFFLWMNIRLLLLYLLRFGSK